MKEMWKSREVISIDRLTDPIDGKQAPHQVRQQQVTRQRPQSGHARRDEVSQRGRAFVRVACRAREMKQISAYLSSLSIQLVFVFGASLTQDGEEHGERGEDPGQTLAAHEQRAVARREQADHPEQTALQHGAERCKHSHR